MTYRHLTDQEEYRLREQGCTADNWANVMVKDGFDPQYVIDAHFSGPIRLGVFRREFDLPGGLKIHAGIAHARIHNCEIGDDCHLWNIHNYIANYRIGRNTCIENVNAILVDGRTRFGNGVRVSVMNEGGGREIPIYDHLSASLAYILTLYRHRKEMVAKLERLIDNYAESLESDMGEIGEDVRILNTGSIKNVCIGDCARITGTSRLKNGTIRSNRQAPVCLGSGVKCTDFIISSGVEISDSTIVDKCFVGQGCIFDKHYSAGDSLFFSNCQGMHGEAAAIFAGPYTVTHHKSTLLIAGMFSFLNAGSGSNQSNHMYKLGPIHQGLAERGAKTTSDSYLLWPSRIGAFSLVMGRHTHHADTADMPFSYLIENQSESYLVPGANLRTVGTIRDAQKWPKRDNRKDPVKIDRINFNLLSPHTVQKMWKGREILRQLLSEHPSADLFEWNHCKIRRSALEHGINFYTLGITKFLGNSLISRIHNGEGLKVNGEVLKDRLHRILMPDTEIGAGDWVDLAGLLAPRTEVSRLMNDIENTDMTLQDIEDRFGVMYDNYYSYEWTWAAEKLEEVWQCKVSEVSVEAVRDSVRRWQKAVVDLDNMVYEDAKKEFDLNSQTGFGVDGNAEQRQADFESVRGSFDGNPFVQAVLEHIQRKTRLGEETIRQLTPDGMMD